MEMTALEEEKTENILKQSSSSITKATYAMDLLQSCKNRSRELSLILGVFLVAILVSTNIPSKASTQASLSLRSLSEKHNSKSEKLKSSATTAPLFMQVNDDSNKNTHPIYLLFGKYGLTGDKPTKNSRPTKYKHGKKSAENGWIYTVVSSGDSCSGTEYMNAGVASDTCIPITGSLSVVVECVDDEISYYEYSSEECSGALQSSKVIATVGCNQALNESSWFNFDDDGYPSSFEVKCSSTSVAPYKKSSLDFDVWSAYDNSETDDTTCSTSNFNYYEAYVTDICIPIQVYSMQSNDESVIFKGSSSDDYDSNDDGDDDNGAGTPWIKYYTEKRTCSGDHVTYDLSTSCERIGALEWAQEWSYFSK